MNPKLFPTIMIGLMLISSIIYFVKGDVRQGIYWLSGAVLNVSVTY